MNNDQDIERQGYEIANAMPSTLEAFTKYEMERVATEMVAKALNGDEDAGEIYIKLDFIQKTIKASMDKVKSAALDELRKYEKGQKCMGVELSITSKVTYDYSNNPEWVKLADHKKKIETDMKEACNRDEQLVLDGEVIVPAIKNYSADAITPKYDKE